MSFTNIPQNPDRLDAILNDLRFDPLVAAEKITGESYKESKGTELLGFLMHLDHVKKTREMLNQIGDTCSNRDAVWTLSALMQNGFNLLLTDSFHDIPHENDKNREPYDERCHILFDYRRNILVWMETYSRGSKNDKYYNGNGSVNDLKFYFNWRAKSKDVRLSGYSGSHVIDPAPLYIAEKHKYNLEGHSYVVSGDIDGRDGMFTKLAWMEEKGEFVSPWIKSPHLWLINYMETRDPVTGESLEYGRVDYKEITNGRLKRLPEDVRKRILIEKES